MNMLIQLNISMRPNSTWGSILFSVEWFRYIREGICTCTENMGSILMQDIQELSRFVQQSWCVAAGWYIRELLRHLHEELQAGSSMVLHSTGFSLECLLEIDRNFSWETPQDKTVMWSWWSKQELEVEYLVLCTGILGLTTNMCVHVILTGTNTATRAMIMMRRKHLYSSMILMPVVNHMAGQCVWRYPLANSNGWMRRTSNLEDQTIYPRSWSGIS